MSADIPRVVIAGLGGDSGKTLLSCGLLAAMNQMGKRPIPFKKGPDYIDPAWLSLAAGRRCRNLDTFMIGREESKRIFFGNIESGDIAIIEGNRGLFDGADVKGTHSTAELAKLLGAAVILIIDGTKVTRTLAALVLGCQKMDSSLRIGGVILNNVSGKRHAKVAVEAIEQTTGIPVIGVIRRYSDFNLLPSRHLGLYTPEENRQAGKAVDFAAEIVRQSVDFDKFFEIANDFDDVSVPDIELMQKPSAGVKIGYFADRAFSFYYPENLEALERAGAELKKLSAIGDTDLHNVDGLYIGGGFPETNVKELCANSVLMERINQAAANGMPIYAECGGLMYLSRSIIWDGEKYEMCKVLPFDVKMNKKPQGHGYVKALVDENCGFFEKGEILRGHEFHYSSIENKSNGIKTILEIKRGKGAEKNRDGYLTGNVFACYLHIHAYSVKNWAENFIKVIKKNKK